MEEEEEEEEEARIAMMNTSIKRRHLKHSTDKYDRTALMLALKEGNEISARVLMDAKADVTMCDCNGNTVLMYAAMSGLESIGLEICRRHDEQLLDVRNRFGKSARDFAIKSGLNRLTVELSLEHAIQSKKNSSEDTKEGGGPR
mmetsp:Transcript_33371/g.46580  ORF Transcript_33371/g.46580 Transcript_33371/m.46580 type:complete len:144 (+) Transcript_33371:147-578(+)